MSDPKLTVGHGRFDAYAKSPQALLDKAIVAVSTPETRKVARLSTLSARVVEAAVAWRDAEIEVMRIPFGEAEARGARIELWDAVDALLAAREGGS